MKRAATPAKEKLPLSKAIARCNISTSLRVVKVSICDSLGGPQMSKTDVYFQFPVAMLKGATETKPTVQRIVSYGLWHYGCSLINTAPDQIETLAEEYTESNPQIGDIEPDNYHHQVLLAAASRLNVTLGGVVRTLKEAKELHQQYGITGTQCRLRADILWDAHNEDWLLNRFLTLVAVIASIGDREAVRVSRERIRTLATGHNSPKNATKLYPILADGTVKHWLDKLRMQNIFRVCKCGKFTWYSIRKSSNGELAKYVRSKVCVTADKLIDAMDVEPH